MELKYSSTFKKQYKKLPKKTQSQFDSRAQLFVVDPNDNRLRNHPLQGNYKGYWSINVTGDIRALYQKDGDTIIVFALIGSHSQLY